MLFAEITWQILFTPFGIPICAILCVFVWLTIASISEAVAKVICNRNDTELKMEMIARGFSSEETIRVIESGRERSGESAAPVSSPPNNRGYAGQA